MNSRGWLTVLAIVGAFVVSYLLRDVIQSTVILPLIYLSWLLNLYYRAVPQFILWVLMVLVVFVSMVWQIPIKNHIHRRLIIQPNQAIGPIETYAKWIKKSPGGTYYKWLVANRLGKLAREILDQREGRVRNGFTRLQGENWDPPQEVDAYLEIGLNGSFADFPRVRWWMHNSTRLDVDLQQVIDYLESEMEASHDGNR